MKKTNFNVYLALLRMYLSFLVVNSHCFNPYKNNIHNKFLLKILRNNKHVPNFFIISFYFCYKLVLKRDIPKIKQRFERLLIPYFIWPIIIWILNNISYHILKIKLKTSFNDLKIQYLTGHNFLTVLWFQYNLIFSTLLIIIIELLFTKDVKFILFVIEIFAYFLQYSNYNYKIFSKYVHYKRYSLGRFFEIIPFCITGYFLASLNIINYLKKFRIKTIYLIILIIFLISKYKILNKTSGFLYQGVDLHILSVNIFIIISLLPSEKIKNINYIKIVKIITNHTSGIYILHIPVKFYLQKKVQSIKKRSLTGCIIIYLCCYFICFFGIKLFGGTKLRHLFQ